MYLILTLVLAAAAQYVYPHKDEPAEVSKERAAVYADMLIEDNAWSGARNKITWCALYIGEDGKFFAKCHGKKTVNADMLPPDAIPGLEVLN